VYGQGTYNACEPYGDSKVGNYFRATKVASDDDGGGLPSYILAMIVMFGGLGVMLLLFLLIFGGLYLVHRHRLGYRKVN